MKNLSKLILSTTLACSLGGLAQQAYAVNLPTCIPNVTCLEFGDFNVYSLPLLDQQTTGGDGVPKPGDAFYAPSSYGQIQNYTILGINNGQSTEIGNPSTTTDGSFNTPSPNNSTNGTFSTATAGDPNGGPAIGDKTTTWDTTTGALKTLVGGPGEPVVAYFAFNETGKGTGLLTTDLLIWAKVTLFDYAADGSVLGSMSFYLTGDGSTTAPDVNNLPAADGTDANGTVAGTPLGYGPWVYVHAGICVSATGAFTGFPDVDGSCTTAGGSVKNQNNLGQNAAAFAVNSPELDAALLNPKWDVFSLDWRMAYINGGGETAWIMRTGVNEVCPPGSTDPICHPIPEPKTLALLGIALLGLVASRRSVLRRRG